MRQAVPTMSGALMILSIGLSMTTPPLSDVIEWKQEKEYLVKVEVHVEAYQDITQVEDQYPMNLKNTPIVFPMAVNGGAHELDLTRLSPKLYLEDTLVRADFKLLNVGGGTDSQLARFVIKEFKGKQIDMRFEEYVMCYDVKVDERAALKIEWPESWDEEVQSALLPQLYIESTNETIAQAVRRLVGDNPREKVTPYLLAKILLRGVVQNFQVTGTSISKTMRESIDGINVEGAEKALAAKRGTLFDAVCLYVAMCRSAGIPTRPVIGLDNRKRGELTAWAEFYLPTAGWVSVDLRKMIAGPGVMKKLDRAWDGFGTNENLNELVPISYYFHPPAGVVAGGTRGKPMLWGWFPVPAHTPTNQRMRLQLQDAPKTANSPKGNQRKKRGSGG